MFNCTCSTSVAETCWPLWPISTLYPSMTLYVTARTFLSYSWQNNDEHGWSWILNIKLGLLCLWNTWGHNNFVPKVWGFNYNAAWILSTCWHLCLADRMFTSFEPAAMVLRLRFYIAHDPACSGPGCLNIAKLVSRSNTNLGHLVSWGPVIHFPSNCRAVKSSLPGLSLADLQ